MNIVHNHESIVAAHFPAPNRMRRSIQASDTDKKYVNIQFDTFTLSNIFSWWWMLIYGSELVMICTPPLTYLSVPSMICLFLLVRRSFSLFRDSLSLFGSPLLCCIAIFFNPWRHDPVWASSIEQNQFCLLSQSFFCMQISWAARGISIFWHIWRIRLATVETTNVLLYWSCHYYDAAIFCQHQLRDPRAD